MLLRTARTIGSLAPAAKKGEPACAAQLQKCAKSVTLSTCQPSKTQEPAALRATAYSTGDERTSPCPNITLSAAPFYHMRLQLGATHNRESCNTYPPTYASTNRPAEQHMPDIIMQHSHNQPHHVLSPWNCTYHRCSRKHCHSSHLLTPDMQHVSTARYHAGKEWYSLPSCVCSQTQQEAHPEAGQCLHKSKARVVQHPPRGQRHSAVKSFIQHVHNFNNKRASKHDSGTTACNRKHSSRYEGGIQQQSCVTPVVQMRACMTRRGSSKSTGCVCCPVIAEPFHHSIGTIVAVATDSFISMHEKQAPCS